jgi:hypothetical protein
MYHYTTATQLTLEAEKRKLDIQSKEDIWFNIIEADFMFLTIRKPATTW